MAAGALLALVALLAGVHVDAVVMRRRVDRLSDALAAARSDLAAATSRVADAGDEQAAADREVERARGEVDEANAVLVAAGIDPKALSATEQEAGEWLGSVEALLASAQRRVDEFASDVRDGKGCVDDGLRSLTEAAQERGEVTGPSSCPALSRGAVAADASTAR